MKRRRGMLLAALTMALIPTAASADDSAESVLGPERLPSVAQQLRPLQPTRADAPRALNASFSGLISGCQVVGWSNCAALGNHYLAGQGADYGVALGDMARADANVAARLDAQLQSGVADALAQANTNTIRDQTFDSGWQAASVDGGDWFYALGTFSIRTVGTVSTVSRGNAGERQVDITYEMFLVDVYDFDPCRGTDPFCVYRHLADLGHAAEFIVYGTSGARSITTTEGALSTAPLTVRW